MQAALRLAAEVGQSCGRTGPKPLGSANNSRWRVPGLKYSPATRGGNRAITESPLEPDEGIRAHHWVQGNVHSRTRNRAGEGQTPTLASMAFCADTGQWTLHSVHLPSWDNNFTARLMDFSSHSLQNPTQGIPGDLLILPALLPEATEDTQSANQSQQRKVPAIPSCKIKSPHQDVFPPQMQTPRMGVVGRWRLTW